MVKIRFRLLFDFKKKEKKSGMDHYVISVGRATP